MQFIDGTTAMCFIEQKPKEMLAEIENRGKEQSGERAPDDDPARCGAVRTGEAARRPFRGSGWLRDAPR
jgi:hypothetical protein